MKQISTLSLYVACVIVMAGCATSLSLPKNRVYYNGSLTLSGGKPEGGTYSGPGVKDGVFYPELTEPTASSYKIKVSYSKPFYRSSEAELEVFGANVIGKDKCPQCNGTRTITCPLCSGNKDYKKQCVNCKGAGNIDVDCPKCSGKGQIIIAHWWRTNETETCSDCSGKGKIKITCNNCHGKKELSCETCHGTGNVECSKCTLNEPAKH